MRTSTARARKRKQQGIDLAAIERERAADRERMNAQVVTAEGETRGQLLALFNRVHNPTHWKLPLQATVQLAMVERYVRAIEFFVGGPTHIEENPEHGYAVLTNAGYYANIGA